MRLFLALGAMIVPTAVYAVDVMQLGGGQYEIVQELGFSYTQDQRQADAARRAAGLASSTSGLSVALKAMKDSAERDLASAEAAVAKSRLLAPTRPEKDDGNIAAAMAQSQGKAAPSQSLTERLAALRARS